MPYTLKHDAIISFDNSDFDANISKVDMRFSNHIGTPVTMNVSVTGKQTTTERINEWLKPKSAMTVRMPLKGVIPAIIRFLAPILPKRFVDKHAYALLHLPEVERGEAYEDENGEIVVPFRVL